ncbi:hypothetical protein CEP54_012973 [Fusarium duplospermum]|uniref:Aminoglycoside phosphotransferase domain-containing protein n=1 Tax=Fusarium duplospermum TaxID=1325734 RepID=A0A428P5T8_9HYPO|nr:hypothetical protein CEP54_012973 [Fusarium duplospermum]
MTQPTREGLGWTERDTSRIRLPFWTTKPKLRAIEVVCRRVLDLQSEEVCTAKFFSSGLFNRLYLIDIPSRQQRLLLRASLPVDPYHKTVGEVATLEWVRRFTNIPVPYVIAYDPSPNNEIGFEWLLMPFLPGTTAYEAWPNMSMTAKVALTKQVAEFKAQLLSASEVNDMRGIGTMASPSEKPGYLVSRYRFMGDHFHYDVPRGPFHSSREWLDAEIRIAKLSMGTDYLDGQDKFYLPVEYFLEKTDELLEDLPTVFPVTDEPEPTTIFHQDLRLENILVDEKGVITAVLDWEFSAAVPRWFATIMPEFLRGVERLPETISGIRSLIDEMDRARANEGLEICYGYDPTRYDPMEYERAQLGKVYTDRMRELRPTWDAEVADSASKLDFFWNVKRTEAG